MYTYTHIYINIYIEFFFLKNSSQQFLGTYNQSLLLFGCCRCRVGLLCRFRGLSRGGGGLFLGGGGFLSFGRSLLCLGGLSWGSSSSGVLFGFGLLLLLLLLCGTVFSRLLLLFLFLLHSFLFHLSTRLLVLFQRQTLEFERILQRELLLLLFRGLLGRFTFGLGTFTFGGGRRFDCISCSGLGLLGSLCRAVCGGARVTLCFGGDIAVCLDVSVLLECINSKTRLVILLPNFTFFFLFFLKEKERKSP